MENTRIRRFTAVAGLVGVALYIVSLVLVYDLPDGTASPQQLAAYTVTHSTQMLLEGYVWGAVVAATLCFLTGVWGVLRQSEGESGVLAMLGLGAGLATFAIVLAGMGGELVLGYRSATLTPTEVKLLTDLVVLGATLSAFPTAVSVGAFSVLVLRTGVVVRWTGALGILVVIAHLVAASSLAPGGVLSPWGVPVYVAPPLFYLWMLSLSIVLVRAPRASQAAATQTSARSSAR